MEPLSRPFHSRKLSISNTSTQNPYDTVFSGRKFIGDSPINIQDYHEIFSTSQLSSIPILDLSNLREPGDGLSFEFRRSNPDYSKIFGGFDEDVAVSYEELFGCDKGRVPSSTGPVSQDSDNLSRRSPDGLKQFNMSYHKVNKKSRDGLDGTKHVTQLPAVTGFTCFIDEPVMEAVKQKQNPSAVNVGVDVSRKQSSGNAARKESNSVLEAAKQKQNPSAVNVSVDIPRKQPSENVVRKESNPVESVIEDKKSKTFGVDFKIHPSSVASSRTNVVNHKDDPKRSINSESCKTDFDDELDVNLAASAALKKAIEKAQESIRIAKESVGRKKKGLRSFSNKKFKNNLEVEGSVEDVSAGEEKKCRVENSSTLFQDVGRNYKHGGKVVFPNFMDSEKLIVAKKFIDEIHEKISESTKDCKFGDNKVVHNATQTTSETESKSLDSDVKDEYATLATEAVDTETSKIQTSDFMHEYHTEVNGEVPLSNTDELVEELSNLNVSQEEKDEKEASQDFNQYDDENIIEASSELLENEKQENVIEHEDGENAESEKDEEIEAASESVRSENESKHDQNSEIHKDEETCETFDDFCERDANDSVQTSDNNLEETCDNTFEGSEVHLLNEFEVKQEDKLEESEVHLHNDCEIEQEDDNIAARISESLDESRDQELDEKLSGDDNVIAEGDDNVIAESDNIDGIGVASNVVEMNDVNVETSEEVDDVKEATREFQAEEPDFCEKASIDQTASDDNEDENEVESEETNRIDNLADLGSENDERSESSSGSRHGVNIIEEESTSQPPETESTNEIKDSREPESRQKQDENKEPGPSKVSGKDRFRKIDEEAAAKEREREKNRLAVERAIREARERAFAEARERAERERAAVEKATEEVRQRMMAEAHEKVSKASATSKPSAEKASVHSKLRAERAAVERATAEARQRALEKAISQKTVSDLNRSESTLRTKAKLEKHNRIMERAAKALAEKEKRDRLAQKEQAERNRLAENLDADIKRWSNGKEGNLRALLSTLQYILGPESGWQPVSLTEIVTTSAVKKAYRKATLCVHPDKLQQRGATIQQKYICEKVFDLLKAAWNKFNSEER